MRMWAGIHFRSDVVAGQKIGEGCGLAGHSVRGSTTRAVGVTLAFDWGLLGATRYGILGSGVPSPELSCILYRKKVAVAHGESRIVSRAC
jgi:hypothetical protein